MTTELELRGFDQSEGNRVKCSQCAAMVVNGVPIHEAGCPNEMHECNGCNEIIPKRQQYCEDCRP